MHSEEEAHVSCDSVSQMRAAVMRFKNKQYSLGREKSLFSFPSPSLLYTCQKMTSKRLSLGSHFLSSKKKTDLSDLFTSFDKDNDGKISHSELEDMLQSAGIKSSMVREDFLISLNGINA